MQKCQYSTKSMQQIGQLQHLGKIQRQVKPCQAEKPCDARASSSTVQTSSCPPWAAYIKAVLPGEPKPTKPVKVQRCSKSILSVMSSSAQRVGPMWAFIVCERRIRSKLQKSLRGKEDRCERSAKTLQVRCKDGIKVSRVRGRHSQSTSDRKGVRRCQKYAKQWEFAHTIWLCNSLPWKITMLLIGKPSISMGHLYHGYVC
jgi:hypothetical protein